MMAADEDPSVNVVSGAASEPHRSKKVGNRGHQKKHGNPDKNKEGNK